MMRRVADLYLRKAALLLAMVAACMAPGCDSDPPPPEELSAAAASALISQKWAQDKLNHFTVSFHSDTVIACGIQNDLWKHAEVLYNGFTISTYQLTDAGRKALFTIDLKDSGKFHEVTLQGPYLVEVTGIAPGRQPDMRQVTIRWEIDWNKAPAGLKACLPRFELSGSQVALFQLSGPQWGFVSFLKPEELAAPPQATDSTLPSALRP